MWKQLNNIVTQLSPYGTKKKNISEGHGADVELAVRPAVVRGTELQSISVRANGHSLDGNAGTSHTYVDDGYVGHPLEAASGPLPAQSACPAVTAAEQDSLHAHSATAQLSDQERSVAESSGILGFDQLLRQLLSQDWVGQCPSGARLVLSLCYELAAVSSPQQQHASGILQLLGTSSSWQAACAHCQDTLLLRALVAHYLPHANNPAASDSWQEQLQEQYCMQDGSATLLPAQFVSAVVAAAQEFDSSSGGQNCVQSLESCIVLGEAAQLQQQQEDSWQCLQDLAAAQLPEVIARPDVQLDTAGVWWHLRAWVAAVVQAAGPPQGQQQRLVADSAQHPSAQWDALLAVLSGLQQQVQEALPVTQQGQLQQAQPGAAQTEFLANGAAAGPGRADSGMATVNTDSVLQQWQALLHKLRGSLPVLLQPADLAAPLHAHETAGVPSSMELVVLLRLAAATSTLWLPLLAACHDISKGEAAIAAAAAAGVYASVGDDVGSSSSTPTVKSKVQVLPAVVGKGDSAVAALWQGAAAGQAPAELKAGSGVALAAAGASRAIAPSLRSPRSSWPDELLSTAQLWPGDVESEDDAEAISREERTLRSWINSVLHQGGSAHSADALAPLSHSHSVDSSLPTGRAQGQGSETAAHDQPRAQSLGGGDAAAAHQPSLLQVAVTSSGSGGVFRSSSAGSAAVAAHLDGEGASSGVTHSRSISAEAFGTGAEVSLDGWAGEPAAPSTPTAAAAASAGSGPLFGAASAISSARVAAGVPSISSVSSLFGAELRSGVLLLEILELLQPGCIDWRLANRPPFVSRTAQLKALENCQLALKVAQEELGLPLVSMSPRDIVLGRRKIILSLVYQLMRFNTMQLLESISAVHSEQQAGSHSRRSSATGGSEPSTPTAASAAADADKLRSSQQQLPPSGLQFARQSGGRVNIRSSSKKQRRQVAITEQDILDWANSKLQQVKPLESSDAASQAPVIRSFRDSLLSTGVILLQLLHVLAPDLVDFSFVTPGHTAEQRQSNARYALSLADKMGCSLFLVWEDLVDPPQPRMVLVLLASLMYHDLKRQQQQAARPSV